MKKSLRVWTEPYLLYNSWETIIKCYILGAVVVSIDVLVVSIVVLVVIIVILAVFVILLAFFVIFILKGFS
jgi:uncharacterized membrane protein